MPTVCALLDRKGHEIISVGADVTVVDAANIMADNGLGAVLVVEGGRTLGIFTERDVLRRVVAAGADASILAHRVAEQEDTIKYLNNYMFYTRGGSGRRRASLRRRRLANPPIAQQLSRVSIPSRLTPALADR